MNSSPNTLTLTTTSPQKYFFEVAKLHKVQLKAGLLAHLSETFLAKFYRFIAANPHTATLVIHLDEDNHSCGFISGATNPRKLYKSFLITHWPSALNAITYFLTKPKFYKRAFSLSKYINRGAKLGNHINAELLSMAVVPQKTRSGVGKQLFNALQTFFYEKDVDMFKVTAAHTQHAAQQFYLAMGGKPLGKIELGLLESSVYVFNKT